MSVSEPPTLKEQIVAAAVAGDLRELLTARVASMDGAWAVVADITDGCRQGCITCPAGPPRTPLTKDTAAAMGRVLLPHAEFLAIGCLAEPLLHPDVAQIIRSLAESKATTGSAAFLCLLTAATVRAGGSLPALAESGLDVLLVSIDATDAGAYGRVRGCAKWDETRTRLDEALPAFSDAGIRVGAQAMLLRCTAPHLRRTVADLSAMGFRSLTFTQPTQVPQKAGDEVLRTDDPAFAAVADLERWLETDGPEDLRLSLPKRDPAAGGALRALFGDGATWDEDLLEGPGICVAPWYNLRVDAAGRIFPCNFMDRPEDALGDVHADRFEDLTTGPKARGLREALLAGRSPTDACRRCAYGPEQRR